MPQSCGWLGELTCSISNGTAATSLTTRLALPIHTMPTSCVDRHIRSKAPARIKSGLHTDFESTHTKRSGTLINVRSQRRLWLASPGILNSSSSPTTGIQRNARRMQRWERLRLQHGSRTECKTRPGSIGLRCFR